MRKLALVWFLALVGACGSSQTTAAAAPPAPPTPPAPPSFKPTSFNVNVSGAGRPVIFIPGLTSDGHVWDATVAHLGGKFQTHVLSLAGFAGNPPIDKPLLPTVREELIEYIRQNHVDHPILVGHSLGGFMTFWVASSAPDLIGGGVAVDGGTFFPSLMDPKATVASAAPGAQAIRDRMAAGPPEQFASGIRAFMGQMTLEPAKHEALIASSTRSDPKTTGEAMYFLFQTDLRADVAKIAAPILVIAADINGQVPRPALEASWNAQIAAIPKHELVIIEHSKHFLMLDQPEAFYAALDKFLAAH